VVSVSYHVGSELPCSYPIPEKGMTQYSSKVKGEIYLLLAPKNTEVVVPHIKLAELVTGGFFLVALFNE
jgi:hypothetical protein